MNLLLSKTSNVLGIKDKIFFHLHQLLYSFQKLDKKFLCNKTVFDWLFYNKIQYLLQANDLLDLQRMLFQAK